MSRRPVRVEYGLLALASVGYFSLMFCWFSLAAFLPVVTRELGLSSTQGGFLVGAVPLVYIPIALFSGAVIDNVGSRRALGVGIVVLGAAQALRAGAVDFWSLLLPTLLFGVGGTGVTFGLPKLVSELFPPERSGTMSSVYMASSYFGTATVFAVGRPVVGPLLGGWRSVFLYSGVVAAAIGVVWFVVAGWLADVETGGGETAGVTDVAADIRAVLGQRAIFLLVAIGTTYLLLSHGMQGLLQTVLEARGLSPTTAGRVTSGLVVCQIAGALVVPTVSDRTGRRRDAVVGCGLLALAGLLGLLAGGSVALTALVVGVVGFGLGGLSPLIRVIPVEMEGIGPGLTGTAVGLVFAVGEAGGFLGPFLIGLLEDLTGSYVPGIGVLALGAVVVVLSGLALGEPGA
ncbi:MAG: CynX/NimT family MFS transporter [Haloarculaceae archaeon]